MTNIQPSLVTDQMIGRYKNYKNRGPLTSTSIRLMLEYVLSGEAAPQAMPAQAVAVDPTNREAAYESLLRAAAGQLKAWHQKYGNHAPSWLPQGGDVSLLKAIDDWLDTNTTSTQPELTLKATP